MADSNFVDYVKIFARSGKGGAGSAHFRRAKYESGDVSPTLTGQMGTGGNNVPWLQKVDEKGVWRDDNSLPPCFHLNTRDELIPTEVPGALMATRNERMQSYIPIEEEHREDENGRE